MLGHCVLLCRTTTSMFNAAIASMSVRSVVPGWPDSSSDTVAWRACVRLPRPACVSPCCRRTRRMAAPSCCGVLAVRSMTVLYSGAYILSIYAPEYRADLYALAHNTMLHSMAYEG